MKNLFFPFLILIIFLFQNSLLGQCEKDIYLSKSKSGTVNYKKFNINNLSTFIYSDGRADINGGNAGFQFPKNSNKYAVYTSGFLIGGKTDDIVSVCGAMYSANISVGALGDDWLKNSWDSSGIYRVKPDYKDSDLLVEVMDEFRTTQDLRTCYENDWNYWPADKGAPFQDLNSNGIYEPSVDIPGYKGAAQTLWYVTNAADVIEANTLFQSPPMDIEIQVTVWGFNNDTYLDNVLFKKVKLINIGNKEIRDIYFSQFVDPDIGAAGDDFAGCDTSLNLGYAYNGDDQDGDYFLHPPAVGFQILKGANKIWGNEGMTAFVYYTCMSDVLELSCPHTDEYEGALNIYNYMQGKMISGEYMNAPDEFGGGLTKYRAPGDPVNNSGWLDGIYEDATSDRYFLMSTGSFNMAAGDTQEIIVAQMAAGGVEGVNRIQAVAELKEIARQIQVDYGMVTGINQVYEIPADFKLYQNYPNPFNPITKIKYSLGVSSKVLLKIYDLLGREISRLVDDFKSPGIYEVDFDASNLPSGIYFYELISDNFSQQRKMILLK